MTLRKTARDYTVLESPQIINQSDSTMAIGLQWTESSPPLRGKTSVDLNGSALLHFINFHHCDS